jgi:hypothetical protein
MDRSGARIVYPARPDFALMEIRKRKKLLR